MTPTRRIGPALSLVIALALVACGTSPTALAPTGRSAGAIGARAIDYPTDLMGQTFRFADVDGDGVLTPAEIQLPGPLFSALDTDHNGQIELSEWTGSASAQRLADATPLARPLIDALFKRLDTNHDGAIQRSELAASLAPSTRKLQAAPLQADFDTADANHDGQLDPLEFAAFYQAFGSDATSNGASARFPSLARALVGSYAVITGNLGMLFAVHAPRFPAKHTPGDQGMSYQDVAFDTPDGLTLRGWFVPASKPTDKTVIMLHGHTSSRGFAVDDGQLGMVHDLYNVLAFDLRNNGESDGTQTTFGEAEAVDTLAAISYLKAHGQHRLAVLGVSMGGAVAIRAAALSKDLLAVVDDCTYAHLVSTYRGFAASTHMPASNLIACATLASSNTEVGYDMTRSEPLTQVGRIAPRPFLVIHGLADTLIPPINSQENYDMAGNNLAKSLWFVPGADHAGSSRTAPTEYRARLRAFLQGVL